MREEKGAIRCCKFEIVRIDGDYRQRKATWRRLAEEVQRVYNRAWQTWEASHHAAGSIAKLQAWHHELLAWHKLNDQRSVVLQAGKNSKDEKEKARCDKEAAALLKRRGPKPKFPFRAITKELGQKMCSAIKAEFRDLHTSTQGLVIRRVQRDFGKRGTNSALPQWMLVLLGRQGRPSFTHPMPIPLRTDKTYFSQPDAKGGDWSVSFRVQRIDSPGNRGRSVEDRVVLQTKSKSARREVYKLERLMSGEWTRMGAFLSLDRRTGKWFLVIAHSLPKKERPDLDKDKSLLLFPGRDDPWVYRLGGRMGFVGGRGYHVIAKRRRMQALFRAANESYRHAGSNRKSRGRKRAEKLKHRIRNGWSAFKNDCNHKVTATVVKIALDNGCGRIDYLQPEGSRGDSRFLAQAGRIGGSRQYLGWDWYQVLAMLNDKASLHGITVEGHKVGNK